MARPVAFALAGYALAAAVLFAPWATREREVVEGTPAHPPLYNRVPVALEPGKRLCVTPVTITSDTERVRFGTLDERRARVVVAARGTGYSSRTEVEASGLAVDAAITPPARDLEGEVCFANGGERTVSLLGTTDARILGRADPVVDGQRQTTTEVALTLLRSERSSYAARIGEMFGHADVVGPGFLAPWMLWLLLPLVAVGIPAGALAALAVAAKPEDREQERREEDLQADDQERGA